MLVSRTSARNSNWQTPETALVTGVAPPRIHMPQSLNEFHSYVGGLAPHVRRTRPLRALPSMEM